MDLLLAVAKDLIGTGVDSMEVDISSAGPAPATCSIGKLGHCREKLVNLNHQTCLILEHLGQFSPLGSQGLGGRVRNSQDDAMVLVQQVDLELEEKVSFGG